MLIVILLQTIQVIDMASRRYSLRQAVAAIQESDSEFDLSGSDSESSDEDNGRQLMLNSDVEDGEEFDEEDTMSESSSDENDPPRQKRKTTHSVQLDTPSTSIIGRNGHQWSTKPNVDPSTKTTAANVLTQRKGLTSIGQTCTYIVDSFKYFITSDMILLIVRETNRRGIMSVKQWNEHNPDALPKRVWKETDDI